ncbi:hypothetical protein [Lacrimispora indolis]|uniref:hypothetical protein n=1 Tax=Lacrimispora indolis TaxID=69825 RepID=UPI000462A131|nr:hypothetical protein [[Clostridium] methoxybenzovorans]
MKTLESKVKTIAEKYADLVEKRLNSALKESDVESSAMCEINDGIRMLNHVAATLERISRLNRGNETND